ncbi:DUF2793 domain-containing protein [Acidimangrovimonas sediminis]|uniref:DUF2793 domain-containing protein n=1 Tax=Acidimangrovimonas sediminis TaxID=2056283 RepID=UPI000C80777D|nr:DUF2793 domain-containing protein [Acidimangrovimonas sediminis]
MENSTNLGLPYLQPSQAQKHVTMNEALRLLDALVQLGVASRTEATPPANPAEGARSIVAAGGTGDWAGHDAAVAEYVEGSWTFLTPRPGWIAWVADEGQLVTFNGTAWGTAVSGQTSSAVFGVNTEADATNRLSVKSDAVLISHDDVTPGTGNARIVVNKSGASDTASVLFQTNYAGRAEFGLTGDDDWRVKVSPDGSAWIDALLVDGTNGYVGLGVPAPSVPLEVAGPVRVGQYAVADLPNATTAGAGAVIFVTDAAGGSVLAYSDGAAWRRSTDRTLVA